MDFTLSIFDYVLIVASLIVSTAVGLYYGAVKRKSNSAMEYFLASRDLSVLQITLSLFSTICNIGQMVGFPAEVYYYGVLPVFGHLFYIIATYIQIKLLFPVIYKIGSPDLFAYYELRFSRPIRFLISSVGVLEQTLSNSILIYGTAVSLSAVIGLKLWPLIIIITVVCIVYSSLGGVRGVSITDTVQGFVIMAAAIGCTVIGIYHVGGINTVWNRNWESGRLNILNFDFDPTTRHTIWTITIGRFISALARSATSQTIIMRLMAAKSVKDCERAALYGTSLMFIFFFLNCLIGITIYAAYYLCDPLSSGLIKTNNKLVSLFIGTQLSAYKGLAGIFFAGLLCASLSTLSSSFNGSSAQIMETFVKPFKCVSNENVYTTVAKLSVVVQGGLALLGISLIEKFPNIFQASAVLSAVTNGPQLVLLCIGLLFPQAKKRCATGAFGFGIIFIAWVAIGSIFYKPQFKRFPTSTEGCPTPMSNFTNSTLIGNLNANVSTFGDASYFINTTLLPTTQMPKSIKTDWSVFFPLSFISYTWFDAIAFCFTFVIFALLTLTFGANKDQVVNFDLIPEPIQRWQKKLSKRWRTWLLCDVYSDASDAELENLRTESNSEVKLSNNK
ncbi:hypothetical protein CHUAL_003388 [Chamberlinius hualienensis]